MDLKIKSPLVSQNTVERARYFFVSTESIHRIFKTVEDVDRLGQMLVNYHPHACWKARVHCRVKIEKSRIALKGLPKPTIGNRNAMSPMSRGISSIFGWKTLTHLRQLRKKMS